MYPHQSNQSQSGPTSCPAFSPAGGRNRAARPQNVNLPRLLIAPHWALWFPGQKRHCLHGEVWKMYSCSFSLCLFSTGVLQKELSRHYIHQPRGYEHLQWTALGLNNFWNGAVTAGMRRLFRRPSPMGLHFVHYSTLRFHSLTNPSHARYRCLDFSLHLRSVISGSNKTANCFIEKFQLCSSNPIPRCRPPTAAVYQVLCLKRL